MRFALGLLVALGLYVAAITLPDPAAAAVGGEIDAGDVTTPVPHRLAGECFTVAWFLEKGYALASDEGWVLLHWIVEAGIKTTLTFSILGSPDLLEPPSSTAVTSASGWCRRRGQLSGSPWNDNSWLQRQRRSAPTQASPLPAAGPFLCGGGRWSTRGNHGVTNLPYFRHAGRATAPSAKVPGLAFIAG